jgi:hypothetical protein
MDQRSRCSFEAVFLVRVGSALEKLQLAGQNVKNYIFFWRTDKNEKRYSQQADRSAIRFLINRRSFL